MNKKLNLIDILIEAINPSWGRFRLKMNTKLASGIFQFEEAFTRDLERMAAEGKIKYDKLSKRLTELVADSGGTLKLTDDDFKILMRSYNFRKAMTESFGELNIDISNPIHIGNLTGNFARIYRLFSGVPESKIIKGAGDIVGVDWSRKIQKGLSDFTRKYFSSFQKLVKIYNSSMEEYMVLEKQLEDEINGALGKVTASDGIGPEVKRINALILRIRDFNNKHPRMFWDKAKIELSQTDEGKLLIKTVEESKYFTIFRDRFAKISPESTTLPNNTYTRWDGIKKLFTPNVALRQKTFWKGVYEWFASIPKWKPKDSRVLGLITTLDARTFSELQFNATVRGNKLSAQSYISYKLIQIFVILPVFMDFFESLFDSMILNYKYTDEELREIFPEGGNEEKASVILTMMKYHLDETYGKDFGNLIWEWSPLLSYLLSKVNTEVGRDSIGDELRKKMEDERNEFKGWLGETKRNVKAFGAWMSSFWDDDVIDSNSTNTPTPEPTSTTTQTPQVTTSQDISESEVDAWVDTNLADIKSEIKKPYTFNSDKSVSIFATFQTDALITLVKNNGTITSK